MSIIVTSRVFMDFARCKNNKDINFYGETVQEIKSAINFCQACPVREACRNYAIENKILYGVWGGMTPTQRKRFSRQNS